MKPKPSGYVPTHDDTPEKFKSRMKRRAAQAAEKVGQPAPVIPVEEKTPPLAPYSGWVSKGG